MGAMRALSSTASPSCSRSGCTGWRSVTTLNRLELGNSRDSRYHKIAHDPAALEATLLAMGVRALPRDTTAVVLDFDASDDRGGGGD